MKNLKSTLKIALLLVFCLFLLQRVRAQTAYGLSDIVYDDTSKQVYTLSGTYLDFKARVFYAPAVCGNVYEQLEFVEGDCYTGYNSSPDLTGQIVFGSLVSLHTTFPSPPNTRFDIISTHYVVAYYSTDIPGTLDDPHGGGRGIAQKYYDPLGFNKQEGQALGGTMYYGRKDGYTHDWWNSYYFKLGYTARSVAANPSECQDSVTTNYAGDECNTLSIMTIGRQFRLTADLSKM